MSTLLIDLAGQELQQEEIELLQHPLVAGVILFSRNFYDRQQIQQLVKLIRHKAKKQLLITVDQEGGRVQRFRQGFTQLPAMQAFTQLIEDQHQQHEMARASGWVMAAEMMALGIDLSFAPVLDIGHGCKAIGDRSFDRQHENVITLSGHFINGMKDAGMASTGKHFPGHGSVNADSHVETPIDDRDRNEIFLYDIQPFKVLIAENRLDAIMPAHVIYSHYDAFPASGSTFWLKEILRQQLGFAGVIFSDDLGMKGADFMGGFVQRCERALQAGCDLLLLCNEREGVIQVLDNLKNRNSAQAEDKLSTLFKRKNITWEELKQHPYWLSNSQKLTELQQRWLASSFL